VKFESIADLDKEDQKKDIEIKEKVNDSNSSEILVLKKFIKDLDDFDLSDKVIPVT
jgi:hypothetical protein